MGPPSFVDKLAVTIVVPLMVIGVIVGTELVGAKMFPAIFSVRHMGASLPGRAMPTHAAC